MTAGPTPPPQDSSLPRCAVATVRSGIGSEIWMERQMQGFRRVDPVMLCWGREAGAGPGPVAEHHIAGDFPQPRSLLARLNRKLGRARAYDLTPSEQQALRAALDAVRPEIVLAHFGWTAIVLAQALPPGIPMVLHAHGRDASVMLRQPAYRAALSRALARCDALVVVGQHQADALRPLGLPARVEWIPCGAPLDVFAAQPLPAQDGPGPVRFLSVGRLSEEKGVLQTLAAFAEMHAAHPDTTLTLIGYGPLQEALRAEIDRRGLSGVVHLPGRMSTTEVAAELAQGHVYVHHAVEHNGWVEGFGVSLTEAAAAGLPGVVSRLGGLPSQITEGTNGFLFDPHDTATQAQLMARLAADATLRARMSTEARRLAARFDTKRMTGQLETLLCEVLAARRARN